MALKISLLKLPKHKNFEYSPRIWDEDAEDREERRKRIEHEAGIVGDKSKSYRPGIKGQFRKAYEQNKRVQKDVYGKRLRFVIILCSVAFLFIAMYYMARFFPVLFQQQEQPAERIEVYE